MSKRISTDYYSFPENNFGSPPFLYYPFQAGPRTFQANAYRGVFFSNNSGWIPGNAPGAQNVSATQSQLLIDSGVLLHFPGALTLARLQVGGPAPESWILEFRLQFESRRRRCEGTRRSGGYYFINGATFALPEGTGSVSNIFLSSGDTFGFGVYGSVNLLSRVVDAQLRVTRFFCGTGARAEIDWIVCARGKCARCTRPSIKGI